MISSVIFDFDGVLGLSRPLAWAAGCRILTAFGCQVRVETIGDYRQVFSRGAQENVAGLDGAETLREMHRLIMRAQAAEIPPHTALVEMISKLSCPVGIVTAGYAATARRCLGTRAERFRFILGHEDGSKGPLLEACRQGEFTAPVYIGDTAHDIRRCHKSGVPICATAWPHAYDEPDDLSAAQPEWLVHDLPGLFTLLTSLHLTRPSEN